MTKLKLIEGGREEQAQEALSALLTGDDAKFDKIYQTMQSNPVNLSLVCGTESRSEPPTLDQPAADKT